MFRSRDDVTDMDSVTSIVARHAESLWGLQNLDFSVVGLTWAPAAAR